MSFIDKTIKPWLIGIIQDNLNQMVVSVNTQTADLSGRIAVTPSAWEPTIWEMITKVATNAIVTIAAIILTFVMCMELIKWVDDKNSFHNSSDVIAQLIRFVIKLGIGVLLVTKAHDITIWIFDVATFALTRSMGVIDTGAGALVVDVAGLTTSLEAAEVGSLINLAFTTLIGGFGMSILGLAIKYVFIGRMIEIYIYCSMGGVPYATLLSKDINSMGQNYIKNLLALGFQGLFMFIMLGIYVALIQGTINNIASMGEPSGIVWEILLVSVILFISLLKSKALAKSIFGAQ